MVSKVREFTEEENHLEDEPDLKDDLLQELEDLIEVPTEELIEDIPDDDLPENVHDQLGMFFHEINRQPLLNRDDEFRLFIIIQAGKKMNEILFTWGDLTKTENIMSAILNLYQNTAQTWDELINICSSSGISKPELGEIFSEIFTQRILGQEYYSSAFTNWFEILPMTGSFREQVGTLALNIPILIMLLPVKVVSWISGYLAKDELNFPPLSELANWLISTNGIVFDIDQIKEISQQAQEKMILSNLRLVIWKARPYQGRGIELEDLIQAGILGLLKAVDKFNPVRGFKFSTYATWWIRQAITRYIADHSRLIRLPVHFHERVEHVLSIRDILVQRLQRNPTPEEIANEDSRIAAESVRMILLTCREPLSLDMKVGNDEGSNVFGDFIPDLEHQEPVPAVDRKILQEVLDSVLDRLPARERKVLTLRYGLNGDNALTLEEVGEKMGVTRERIRQIENQALSRMRHPTIRRLLREFL